MMVNGRLAQEMRESDSRINLNWSQEKTSNTQADLNLSSADRNRVETALAPARFALDEWVAKVGKGSFANEARSAAEIVARAIGGNDDVSGVFTADLRKQLLEAGISEGDIYLLQQMLAKATKSSRP